MNENWKNGSWKPEDDNTLKLLSSFRYCLGRNTHIIHRCAIWIKESLEFLHPSTLTVMAQEIREKHFNPDLFYDPDSANHVWLAVLRALENEGKRRSIII